MLTRRIIACLDVRDGQVVKGVRFRNHEVVGSIVDLARRYRDQGADELVFYDIAASAEGRAVDPTWVRATARVLDIPFCVAGGIRSVESARAVLNAGADKISINSPALERPELIRELAETFGQQCVVVGIDSTDSPDGYVVWQYTGSERTMRATPRRTEEWVRQAQALGAGEIVLNCMDADGTRDGYDIRQLAAMRSIVSCPLIASGGAGRAEHFRDVFRGAEVDGALAAGIFHRGEIEVPALKSYLRGEGIAVRL
jgi:cyclase